MTSVDLTRSVHWSSRRLKIRRAVWEFVWRALGKPGPRGFSGWRCFLLRSFGASIGHDCLICGGVDVLMPWNVKIGNYVAIAERVNFYSFDRIEIGDQTSISAGVVLCTGTHDYRKADHPLVWKPIYIGSQVWICMEAFLAPGVSIGEGAVIGARAVVTSTMPSWMVSGGNPSRPIKERRLGETLQGTPVIG